MSGRVVPMRPTHDSYADLTPQAVAQQMLTYCRRMESVSQALRDTAREAARAEVEYRQSRAQAILRSEKSSADKRDAEALTECREQMFDAKIAEADAEAARTYSANLRALLSAGQSLLQLAKTEAGLAPPDGAA